MNQELPLYKLDLGKEEKPEIKLPTSRASLVAQTVKSLPTMQETWVRPLAQEDSLEEGMATHSSIPAWRIPWAEETGGLHRRLAGSHRVGHN